MRNAASLRFLLIAHFLLLAFIHQPQCKEISSLVGDPVLIPQPNGPPLPGFVWYPAPPLSSTTQPPEPSRFPLIVVSHGALGNSRSQDGLMRALAQAGFITAAISHNEFKGHLVLAPENRTAQFHSLIDYMLNDWPGRSRIDPRRVGAFGFSLGGFTVLVAAGGKPDISLMASHCDQAPAEWSCSMEHDKHLDLIEHPPPASAWVADHRIKAVAIVAPAMGYLFGARGLAAVQLPIQLWQGNNDRVLAAPWNAEIVQRELPHPAEYHVVAGHHGDLLTTCSRNADIQPDCASRQAMFQLQVADFFERTLH